MNLKENRKANDALRREINSLLGDLYKLEGINNYNLSDLDKSSGLLSWNRISDTPLIEDFAHLSIEDYLLWTERSDYSALLFDGSLLQLSYKLSGAEVVGHRLAYVPSPFVDRTGRNPKAEENLRRTRSTWMGENYVEHVLGILSETPMSAGLRSIVRFDYDPDNAKDGHAAAHLTFNSVDCRIPCISPLSPSQFLEFIFSNFYPQDRKRLGVFFDSLSLPNRGKNLLQESERTSIHMSW